MLWLGLHFPLLALEVFTAGAPDDDRPRVVTDAGRVLLGNAAALAGGVAVGSTLATAHSIVSPLDHFPRDRERERQRLELLAETLYGFSARVSIAPGESPGIVLEIGASLRLFGAADDLEEKILTLCRDLGHEVRAHRATTPLAALILARSDGDDLGAVSLVQAAVEPALNAGRIERLANMGVQRLGQLLALPRRGLARRFGEDLVDYLDRITGDRPDPRPLITPAERFSTTLHLLEPLNDKQALAFPLQRLLSDLQHWLVARQLGAEQLVWQFASSAPGNRAGMAVQFARAQQRRETFLDITRLKLAETVLPDDVIDVTLEARRLVPWSTAGRSLFRDLPTAEPEDAGALVDQLRARLGDGACHGLVSIDQHTPEAAWRRVSPLARSGKPPDPGCRSERPLWLFEPPRAVARQALTLLRGPERVHTGWWLSGGTSSDKTLPVGEPGNDAPSGERRSGEARDYYVARHRSGAECWVFVNPEDRWFLHGYFG